MYSLLASYVQQKSKTGPSTPPVEPVNHCSGYLGGYHSGSGLSLIPW